MPSLFRRFFCACSLLTLLSAVPLLAQDARGKIVGRILDSSSAVVPNADVTATHVDMNVRTSARANDAGNYELPFLLPGTYRINVKAAGFKEYSRQPILVRVGDTVTLDLTLEVGSITETVNITAEASLLEASTAGIATVVEHKQLSDLPIGGGDPMFLTQLSAGVTTAQAPGHNWLPSAADVMSNVNIAGTANGSNEFTLDGISNMTRGWVSFTPPADMVQEFRVQTVTYDASLGHAAGGTINMSLKTGTNQMHGTAQWEVAPNPWQANDFFTNKQIYDTSTGPVTPEKIKSLSPPRKVNRYSATLGGPLYLPHLYNGHSRTFWTYGFQGFNRRNPNNNYYTVPTAAEQHGDFSALLAIPKTGPSYQIYDPATIAPAPGGLFSRQPLPGNLVPASRISPIAQNYLKFFAQPNVTGTVDGRNDYQITQPDNNDFYQNMARVDHNFSDRNRLFGRFTESWLHFAHGNAFTNDARGIDRHRKQWGAGLDDVYTFSPTLILNVKYGFTRYLQGDFPNSVGYNITSLGVPAALASQLNPQGVAFPVVTIDGMAQLGETGGTQFITNYQNLAGGFTKISGNHTIRWGGEFRLLRENNVNYGNAAPNMDFSNTWTKGPFNNSGAGPIGQGLASFLLGIPTGGGIDLNANYAEQSTFTGLYVQDDWKLTRKLTVNIGLRWEYGGGPTERYNRSSRGFDFTAVSPIYQAALAAYTKNPDVIPVSQFKTPGVLTFAGIGGQSRSYFDTDTKNFAPRFGMAYQLTPKTVLRSGYGIFNDTTGIDNNHANQQGFSQRTNLIPSTDNGLTFTSTLANPFPNGLVKPSPVGPDTYIGRAITFNPSHLLTPYMQRWSFSVQRELPSRSVIELSYVGNRGTHIGTSRALDFTPAQYLSKSIVRDQNTINYLSFPVPNPFNGIPQFAGGGITGATITRGNLLRPYPQYNGMTVTDPNGQSWYHSLQFRADKRFSHGVLVGLNYTWSKYMDATEYLNNSDPLPTHVISASDRPHRVTINGVWELPVGKGRMWMAHAPRLVDAALGGWQYQAIWLWQVGAPVNFGNIVFLGDVRDIAAGPHTLSQWFNVNAGFDRNSANALANNIRAFPLRLTGVRSPGPNYWNMALYKQFVVRERLKFQVRTEWEGALNTPQFAAPNAAPANSLFGQINGTQGEARRIYAGLKLMF